MAHRRPGTRGLCSSQSSLLHYKEDSVSLGVHASHLWPPGEMTTRAMDAPVFQQPEKIVLIVKTPEAGVTVSSDMVYSYPFA